MANLRYSDKHNMVAFLKKPTESEGFTEIVDFLKGSKLRTLANEHQELVASIDNREYTITEASVRSKLQLADASGDHVPLLPAMLAGASPDQGERSAIPTGSQPHLDPEHKIPQSQGPTLTPVPDEATTTRVEVDIEGATTTTSSLDAGLDSGNIHESPLRSHETPLHVGHTSGSVEDNVKLQELMVLVPKLESKVDSLEKELKETKQTLGSVVLTLVKKVKSLEVALRRKTKKVCRILTRHHRKSPALGLTLIAIIDFTLWSFS
ncbi:hypothetical protein Tco_0105192 [Tanacetum coccineum]